MRFAHDMPFGAQVMEGGGVRFRLWAPSQAGVNVVLEEDKAIPMNRLDQGWFELNSEEARPNSRYSFELSDGMRVPDPASRCQASDVHGPSLVVDPRAYEWRVAWTGRPWEEAVLYEFHVGLFSSEGSFDGVRGRLDYLANVGITAIELMPVAAFSGRRNWGYDGVLPYAPASAYGRPEDLKALVDAAHERGLMAFLDVVYNHFGPDGNYLNSYAPSFFTERHKTPWGAAIDFSQRAVRDFFVHNALFWLREYQFDGLRLDAVHAIIDEEEPDILVELAERVRQEIGPERQVHLVLENDDNAARYLDRADGTARHFTAQWNDDFHHVAHALLTGERGGYYADYADQPGSRLLRALTEGFVYQGEPSPYRDDAPRGEPSAHLPPLAFVNFLQNHDQIGNRAFGERLSVLAEPAALRALTAVLLLVPQIPLLFMGEEWGSTTPFYFFCDFDGALADAVREGRRREFERFPQFADPAARSKIPDPNALETFEGSRLVWSDLEVAPGKERFDFVKDLLRLRREIVRPYLAAGLTGSAHGECWGESGLSVVWPLADQKHLSLVANLGDAEASEGPRADIAPFFVSDPSIGGSISEGRWPPWSCAFFLGAPQGGG